MADQGRLRFGILGPLTVERDGEPIPLPQSAPKAAPDKLGGSPGPKPAHAPPSVTPVVPVSLSVPVTGKTAVVELPSVPELVAGTSRQLASSTSGRELPDVPTAACCLAKRGAFARTRALERWLGWSLE